MRAVTFSQLMSSSTFHPRISVAASVLSEIPFRSTWDMLASRLVWTQGRSRNLGASLNEDSGGTWKVMGASSRFSFVRGAPAVARESWLALRLESVAIRLRNLGGHEQEPLSLKRSFLLS